MPGQDLFFERVNRSTNQETAAQNGVDARAISSGPARSRFALIAVSAFLISIVFPLGFSLGGLYLNPYRLVALGCVVPCFFIVMSGRAGGVRTADVLMTLHALLAVLALLVNHGLDEWEFAGIYVAETLGPYLLARCAIRSAADFKALVRGTMVVILFLLPFTVFEALTGKHVLRSAFGLSALYTEDRLGLSRATGPFEHPILYGNFCASCFGIVFYGLGRLGSRTVPFVCAGLIFVATLLSLSSGPLSTFAVQVFLIGWDKVMRIPHRWRLLTGLALAAYVVVDLISNRTPFHVITSYLTFDPVSAYARILIYEFGGAEVFRHPLFGIGLHDWVRPEWMASSSVDAFWLLQAMRYGLPSALCLLGALLVLCFSIGRRRLPPEIARYRTGWLVTIVGLTISGISVHYWGGIFCWLMFLLGSSTWMLEPSAGRATKVQSQGNRMSSARWKERDVGDLLHVDRSTDTVSASPASGSPRFCRPEKILWVRTED